MIPLFKADLYASERGKGRGKGDLRLLGYCMLLYCQQQTSYSTLIGPWWCFGGGGITSFVVAGRCSFNVPCLAFGNHWGERERTEALYTSSTVALLNASFQGRG